MWCGAEVVSMVFRIESLTPEQISLELKIVGVAAANQDFHPFWS
jgi:hypothetical protein